MKVYYDRRAQEYDDWWLGRGRFADLERPGWDADIELLIETLRQLAPAGTLDVACGTGFLTRHLPGEVVALDQSPNMIEAARARNAAGDYVVADAFELPFPDQSFDRVFASYFYCHLEDHDRTRFLAEVRRVAPELVLVATRWRPGEEPTRWEERVLNDGSRWQVYKRVFEPEQLLQELGGGEVLVAGRFLVARSP